MKRFLLFIIISSLLLIGCEKENDVEKQQFVTEEQETEEVSEYDFLKFTKYFGKQESDINNEFEYTYDNGNGCIVNNCDFLGIDGNVLVEFESDSDIAFVFTFYPYSKNIDGEYYKTIFKDNFEVIETDIYADVYIYNEKYKMAVIYDYTDDKKMIIDLVQMTVLEQAATDKFEKNTDIPEDCWGFVDLIGKDYREIGFGETGADALDSYVGEANTTLWEYSGIAQLHYNENIGVIEYVRFYFDNPEQIDLDELLDICRNNYGEIKEPSDRGMSRYIGDEYTVVVAHPLETDYSGSKVKVEPVLNYVNIGLTDETILDEIKEKYYSKDEEPQIQEQKKILDEPKIGMTPEEIENSTWGFPNDINKTTTEYGVHEQWVYGNGKYIYFDDGKVTAIQE